VHRSAHYIARFAIPRLVCVAAFIAIAATPATAQYQEESAVVAARLKELQRPTDNVPDNEMMLLEELRRVRNELAQYRGMVADTGRNTRFFNEVKSLEQAAPKLLSDAVAFNCETQSAAAADDLIQRLDATADVAGRGPRSPWPLISPQNSALSPADLCRRMKSIYGNEARNQARLTAFRETVREFETAASAESKFRSDATQLIPLLEQRAAEIEKRLSSANAQQKLSGTLWLVILVIGLLSLGAIVAIKLFSEPLQVEWVASGQVIQFVTVMILLSVIMALGLVNVITENTLGTLLGGIAGYVLSQGVGRAAAREVTRSFAPHLDRRMSSPGGEVLQTSKAGANPAQQSTNNPTNQQTNSGFDDTDPFA
jgi:hypothetical protein